MSEWIVHVDSANMDFFVRNMLSITVVQRLPNGSVEYNVNWGSMDEDGASTIPTRYIATSDPNFGVPNGEVRKPMPILIDIEAARAVMDALGRHFGIYAGADYARLREDYDRVTGELREANTFIREQFAAQLKERPKRLNGPRQRSSDAQGD